MTAIRPLSLPLHGALELLTGLLVLLSPFALGFTSAGIVVAFLVGVCAVGLALDATQPTRVASHRAFDAGLAVASMLVALPLALAGDHAASLLLGCYGLTQLALTSATRYSARP